MNRPNRPLRVAFAALLAVVFFCSAAFAAELKKEFAISADQPTAMLKQFSAQSGQQLLYSADALAEVKLTPVRGRMTPREALEQMVKGTALRVVVDRENGALSLVRQNPTQGKAAPDARSGEGVSIRKTEHDVLQLQTFEVRAVRPPGIVNEGVIPRREGEAMPFQVFERDAIERTGATSLADFFRSFSGNASQGFSTQGIYGQITQGASSPAVARESIDLRGLGDNKTVVLLNGRRLYGSDTQGPDIARIPLSAVERIEVLTGSASAIYGANAIGGAVNIILRKNYRSGEATLYVGTSTEGGGTEYRGTVFQGFTSDNGRWTGNVTLEHIDRAGIKMSDRRYYLEALTRISPDSNTYRTVLVPQIGGVRPILYTFDTPPGYELGVPSNPALRYAIVPAGYSRNAPVSSDFNSTGTNTPLGISSRLDDTYLQPPEKITSANLQGEYSLIKDRLGFYTEVAWRQQKLDLYSSSIVGNILLFDDSSFNPFANDPAPPPSLGFVPWVNVALDPVDLPRAHQVSSQRTRRVIAGLKGTLPTAKKWHWALDYSHDEDRSEAQFTNYTQFLNFAVENEIYNPVRDLRASPNNVDLAQLRTTTSSVRAPTIDAGNLRLSGEVLTLPAGELQASAGLELRRERFHNASLSALPPVVPAFLQGLLASFLNNTTTASREARAGYLELNVPIIGGEKRLPLVHELSFNAAARREAYRQYSYRAVLNGTSRQNLGTPENISDTPVALGLKYAPSRHFALRASWAEAFISPSMDALFAARTTLSNGTPLTFFDPVLNAQVTRPLGSVEITQGGNSALKPETGYSLNYGVVFTPRWEGTSGLTLSFDYFRITNDNQVANPTLTTILTSMPSRVTRNASNQVIAYDTTAINVSRLVAAGCEAKFNWTFSPAEVGQFTWSGQATYYDTYKRQDFPNTPFNHVIADRTFGSNTPLRLKGQTALFWSKDDPLGWEGSFTAGVTSRYVGHYKNTYNVGAYSSSQPGPPRDLVDGEWISSSMEFDVQFSYSVAKSAASDPRPVRSWLDGTRWTIGALNVTDRRPPYSTVGFYSFYNDPRQRFVYFEIKKTF